MDKIEVNTNMASKNGFLMAASVLKGVFLEVQGYHCNCWRSSFPRSRATVELRKSVRFRPRPNAKAALLTYCKIFSPRQENLLWRRFLLLDSKKSRDNISALSSQNSCRKGLSHGAGSMHWRRSVCRSHQAAHFGARRARGGLRARRIQPDSCLRAEQV